MSRRSDLPGQHADPAPVPRRLLRLVGGFRLEGGPAPGPSSRAGCRLLALLGLRGPSARAAVAATLWPDASDTRASGSLRSALWRVRRAGVPVVELLDGRLALPDDLDVDVSRFSAWAMALDDPAAVVELDIGAVPRGELLPGWQEEWIGIERERLDQQRLAALEVLAERCARLGRRQEAMEAGLRAVELDPLREGAVRTMVTLHLELGNVAQALLLYERFRAALRREVGVEPSSLLRRLVDEVRRGEGPHVPAPRRPYADSPAAVVVDGPDRDAGPNVSDMSRR
jgi:DNA-binding SARP family transcriptional activator